MKTISILSALVLFLSLNTQANGMTATFFQNFLNKDYAKKLDVFSGGGFGDANANYAEFSIRINPGQEVYMVGEFPNARFMSVTVTDDHGAVIATMADLKIKPLSASHINPFKTVHLADQLYGISFLMGNQRITNEAPSCSLGGIDNYRNVMDGRFRHTLYNHYSELHKNFIDHDTTIRNTAIHVAVRYYSHRPVATGTRDFIAPVVFVRNIADGCAVKINEAGFADNFLSILNQEQFMLHIDQEKDLLPEAPYGIRQESALQWYSGREFVYIDNPHTRYLNADIPANLKLPVLKSENKVMRMRFRVPGITYREDGVAFDGTEQLRYWSMVLNRGKYAKNNRTLVDKDLTIDSEGYVTLIINPGLDLPPGINSDNGYTRIDLVDENEINTLGRFILRNILPLNQFDCSVNNVPYRNFEYHPAGGYMGEYTPIVDTVPVSELPDTHTPLRSLNNCSAFNI